jgi:hypothetical protein
MRNADILALAPQFADADVDWDQVRNVYSRKGGCALALAWLTKRAASSAALGRAVCGRKMAEEAVAPVAGIQECAVTDMNEAGVNTKRSIHPCHAPGKLSYVAQVAILVQI